MCEVTSEEKLFAAAQWDYQDKAKSWRKWTWKHSPEGETSVQVFKRKPFFWILKWALEYWCRSDHEPCRAWQRWPRVLYLYGIALLGSLLIYEHLCWSIRWLYNFIFFFSVIVLLHWSHNAHNNWLSNLQHQWIFSGAGLLQNPTALHRFYGLRSRLLQFFCGFALSSWGRDFTQFA